MADSLDLRGPDDWLDDRVSGTWRLNGQCLIGSARLGLTNWRDSTCDSFKHDKHEICKVLLSHLLILSMSETYSEFSSCV